MTLAKLDPHAISLEQGDIGFAKVPHDPLAVVHAGLRGQGLVEDQGLHGCVPVWFC